MNDELLGIPDDPPESTEAVGDTDNLFLGDESKADQELDQALAEATGGLGGLNPFRRLSVSGPLLILILCFALLFLLAQTLPLINQLVLAPAYLRYPGMIVLILLLGGIFYALWQMVRVFRKMRITPRIPLDTLQQLANRAELRCEVNIRLQQAKATLQDFLSNYPLNEGSETMTLLGRYLDAEDLNAFKKNAGILRTGPDGTSEGWLQQYDRQFLCPLDQAARKCIRRYATRVSLKTAALPAGFDTAVILLNAYLLAKDMCVAYNLRTNGPGTAAVLMRVLFNAFAASRMQDMTEAASEMFFEGGGALAGMGRAVGSRLAEGGVNALLFMRLGAAMVRHLRPIWPPHKLK